MQTRVALPLLSALLLTACGDDSSPIDSGSTGGDSTGVESTSGPDTSGTTPGSTGSPEETTTEDDSTGDPSDTDADTDTDDGTSTGGVPHECELGDLGACVDETTAEVCEEVDGVRTWVEVACEAEAVCVAGGCASPVQQEFIQQLDDYLDGTEAGTAVAVEMDWDDLHAQARALVVVGDDTPDTLYRAARALQLQIPQGHQWVRFDSCGVPEGMPYSRQTFYGACGRISGDGVIVTVAADDNPLGLTPGDRIVGTSRWAEGASFLDEVAAEPLCSSLTPTTTAAARRQAAGDLLGLLHEGDTITVIDPDGTSREVDVPAGLEDDPIAWCLNPIEGGYSTFEAQLTMRPDGIAVIRVPHFGPSEHPFPNPFTTEAYYQWVSDYVDRLADVMSTIPDDAPIIWDARGNSGGAAEVPLAIVAGMPGANRTAISEGYQRISDTSPVEFYDDPIATFSFEVPNDDRLVHNAPTAVLVDFAATSAADFFAWGAKDFSDAILVGTPATANYGFGGLSGVEVPGSVASLTYRNDPLQSRMLDGTPLEGYEVEPDIVVEYDPADLAGDVDTVMEAAAAALLE